MLAATVRSATSSTTSPGLAGVLLTRSCTARPTISAASSASVAVGGRSPTTLPRRMTVIVSAIACTSLSLCEMNTIDRPPALQLAHDPEQVLGLARREHGGGLVEDEHAGLAQQAP